MSSKTAGDLYTALLTTGMSGTPDTQAFAQQVHSLVPRKAKVKAVKPADQVASRYALLQDEAESSTSRKEKKKRDKGKEKEKVKNGATNGASLDDRDRSRDDRDGRDGERAVKPGRRGRKRDTEGNWDDDPYEEEEPEQEMKRARFESPGSPEPEETEEERLERERLEDLAERDAFAERMKQKDSDKQKKLVVDKSSRSQGGLEAEKRAVLADDAEARKAVMEDLRLHSRQEYLSKREMQRLDLLKLEIEDEKMLFRNQKMSKRELAEFERKKELIKIMEARQRIDDGTDGYMLPDDYITEQGRIDAKKRKNALYARYEEAKPVDGQFVTDVDQWEESQKHKTDLRTGAMDVEFVEEAYDYVFDESQGIQFLKEGKMEGTLTAEAQAMLDSIAQAEQRGEFHPCRHR
jgi:pre-mRNA-splicing factor ATP-dependent RNA helicase DHX16